MWNLHQLKPVMGGYKPHIVAALRFINMLAPGYTCFLCGTITCLTVWISIPYASEIYGYHKTMWQAIMLFMLSNYYYNFLQIKRHDSKVKNRTILAPTPTDRYQEKCDKCQIFKPPRSKHCIICNECIVKRNHHCFLTGICIGLQNQQYFIRKSFYICLAAYLSVHFALLWLYPNFTWVQCFNYSRSLRLYHNDEAGVLAMIMVLAVNMSTAACGNSGFAFCLSMLCVCRGQTYHEFDKGIKTYSQSLSDNLRSVFGPNWYLNLLFPWKPPFSDTGNAMS